MVYNIADRIKYLRDKVGLTQTDLANKLGISRSAVNSWEMAISLPSLTNIIEMSEIFHVSIDYIVCVENKLLVDITNLTNEEREAVLKIISCFETNRA